MSFCTSKEWETCNQEKMGCEGCHYNSKNLFDIKTKEKVSFVRAMNQKDTIKDRFNVIKYERNNK